MTYAEIYAAWRDDPEKFWMSAAEDVAWNKPPSKAFFSQGPVGEWFADGRINTCWNAVDRHVEAGLGDQPAIIHDSPVTQSQRIITYGELKELVGVFAGALQAHGLSTGDRAIIYMPMVAEALIAMLACQRIGVIHSVVFGGFAASELALRIDDAQPKAIIAASCGIEPGRIVPYKDLLDRAITTAQHKPEFCVILQREQSVASLVAGRDHDWHEFQKDADVAECVPVAGNHPAYILYTSGTTGRPKGVVRDTAGHLVALNWTMRNIYGIGQGDVFWTASDVGWVVGHSYICYGPLIAGATTVVYEGKPVGTPDAGAFWRVIQEHKVKSFFTAPTAIRAIKRDDPEGKLLNDYDLSSLQALFLAGERADPDTITWAEQRLGVPVIDHWWQTETGWAIAANPFGIEQLPIKRGSPSVPMPGYDVQVLDEAGVPVPSGMLGAVAIRLPLPPGTLPTLWHAEDRFQESYLSHFPGFYETGDAGYLDEDGYLYIMSRTDDVINVAGHRLSTGALEEVLASHPAVAECAVIGVADPLKGQVPLGLFCLKKGVALSPEEVSAQIVQLVRERIGPVAAFKTACMVDRLPKTRSGKILRGTIAAIADGKNPAKPATIDDPVILDEIDTTLKNVGYGTRSQGSS